MRIPTIRPYEPADAGHFCRLFKPLEQSEIFDLEAMKELGRSMINRPLGCDEGGGGGQANTPAPVYTYFGQFIDHDLTWDNTLLKDAGLKKPSQTLNPGGGRLDLNHLYGQGPESRQHGHLFEGDGSFKLGQVKSQISHQPFDLPLKDGSPQAADDRTAENLILRQMAVMFMRLHNIGIGNNLSFEDARQNVTWQYQWLVRRDFLSNILHPDIYDGIDNRTGPGIVDWSEKGFSVPVEFSQAAFRFGHSIVRECYQLNAEFFTLKEIFDFPQRNQALTQRQAINWATITNENLQRTMGFDTSLVNPLGHLPPDLYHHKHKATTITLPHALPVRTLLRGAMARLPTGQTVAKAFGHPQFDTKPTSETALFAFRMLEKYGLVEKTPLWYYLLLEADVDGHADRLGKVGSMLIAEIIEGSLLMDECSYIRQNGNDWTPPPWSSPYPDTHKPIYVTDLDGASQVSGLDNE